MGVDWTSEEGSDLVEPPLNLVLYMHLRIFAYTSNTLIVSFECMDCMIDSGTWKNFRFFLRSYSLIVNLKEAVELRKGQRSNLLLLRDIILGAQSNTSSCVDP
jgi:hypothetical protein